MPRKQFRDLERERFWREAIGDWKKSGQTIRAFCAGRGLREPNFYHWRQTLIERDSKRPPIRAKRTLVPVRIVPESVIEIVLPRGLVVRVPAGADTAAVAKLVAALGSTSC